MSERLQYHYSIDGDDELCSVDAAWLEFARRNDAGELTTEAVLGRPVWSFIAGERVRQVYELLFRRVRDDGKSLSVPLRCDSPDRLRFMNLGMSPSALDGIDFRCILEREQIRPHTRLLERLRRPSVHSFPMCSFCKRVLAFGEWLELEEATARLQLLEGEDPPAFEQALCDSCAALCRAKGSDA